MIKHVRCPSCNEMLAGFEENEVRCCKACWAALAPSARVKLIESQKLRLVLSEKAIEIAESARKFTEFMDRLVDLISFGREAGPDSTSEELEDYLKRFRNN